MSSKKKQRLLLVLILILGAFFRFYKLDWGSGYYFHPDEYHIAASVKQLNFPDQMNPHFFSYGTVVVYLIYFSKRLLEFNPILIGRFWSALFSTLTIYLVYLISKKIFKQTKYFILSALLVALTPGLIQQAHFATPESILTFWLFLVLYLLLNNRFCLAAISLGLAVATKITALTFVPVVLFSVIRLKKPLRIIKVGILVIIFFVLTYLIISPYTFLDYDSFRSSMIYETGVGRGNSLVFYTRQFVNTVPVIFQLEKIFPYALGLPLFLLGFLGLFVSSPLVVIAFLSYFIPNAFLFAKWTRFIAPVFPFFALFTVIIISKIKNRFLLVSCYLLLVISILWSLIFFSLYFKSDIRITATNWLNENLIPQSSILTEAGNMLEVPLSGLPKITFDFYHLDEDKKLQDELPGLLAQSDYFIVQSRRMYSNHQRLPDQFPITARFYNLLFSGKLGYTKIKDFNPWSPINFSDEQAEETWTVFDHPVIRIYQKVKPYTAKDYEKMLAI